MALGAAYWQVLWMILRDSLVLIAAGKLPEHDPVSFTLAVAVTILVSLAAAFIPPQKATWVDPMQALRAE